MNRKSKALGLALLAALVMGAVGAQGASGDLFVSEVEDTVLTSESDTTHEFTVFENTVKCEITNFAATQPHETAAVLTVTPTYDECIFGGITAEVRTNHCDYLFTSTTAGEHAPVHVECQNQGEHIELETPAFGHCVMTIAPQTSEGGVTYANGKQAGSEKEEVTVKVTATVNVVRDTNENFFCELFNHEGTGTYTGASWVKGYEYKAGPSTEFTADETATTEARGTTHWSWEEGGQVDVSVNDTT